MGTTMADSVVIDVPQAAVWAFVTDPPKLHGLQPNTDVRLLSGTYDTVGSRYLVTTRAWRRTFDTTHEIVRFEPTRLIKTRATSEGTVMQSLLQIEALRDDACVLIMQGTTEWGGSFVALVSRVMTALAGRTVLSSYLDRLKRAIEADAGRELSGA